MVNVSIENKFMQENLEDIFINKISTIRIDVDKIENQWKNDEDSSNLSKNKEFIDSNDFSSIESIANKISMYYLISFNKDSKILIDFHICRLMSN